MGIKIRNIFRDACFAAGLLATADAAYAGVIVSGATVLDNEQFVINAATSSLAYNPGTYSIGTVGSPGSGPSPTVNYNIGGSFDVTIWTIDNLTTDWLTISNVAITANGLPSGFQIPDFVDSIISGPSFYGSDDACFYTPPGGGVCTILFVGSPRSYITGQLQSGAISFSAFVPVGVAIYGGGSTYQINAATAIPVPAAFWLFASAMGFCGVKIRQRKS